MNRSFSQFIATKEGGGLITCYQTSGLITGGYWVPPFRPPNLRTPCITVWYLAWIFTDISRAQIRTQVNASFHRLATQRKSTQVDRKSAVVINWINLWEIQLRLLKTCANLQRDLQIRLATLCNFLPKFWFLQTIPFSYWWQWQSGAL